MHIQRNTLKLVTAFALSATLVACGGGGSDDASRLDDIGSNNNNGGGSTSSSSNTTYRLGVGSGNDFQNGVIGIGIDTATLSAGGSTTLTVNIANSNGNLITESVTVSFGSPCVAAGTAKLTVNGAAATGVTTTSGEASLTYTANGCVGSDKITANATYQSSSLSATSTINIESDTLQSITFNSASRDRISLKGTGSGETSVLAFQVLGSTGVPMQNVDVNFTLNTSAGGANLTTTAARTGSDGLVSTTLQAGTIAATARVTATAVGTEISTQSDPILISTGIPDQKSMTLSAETYNPDSWGVNGVVVPITVQLADAFNNPPPEGTYVTFTTSGGSIDPGCTTAEDGSCVLNWRSGQPRPASGQITILAHTPGNESFIDINGNGWYDIDIDTFASGNAECAKNTPESSASGEIAMCDDLGDAYLDKNYNGLFDGTDTFIDFDPILQPGYSTGNGMYNGALCRTTAGEVEGVGCTTAGVTIRQDIAMVMSSEQPYFVDDRLPGQPALLDVSSGNSTISLIIGDINGNSLPSGTVISISLTNAQNVTANRDSVEVPKNALGPLAYNVKLNVVDPTKPVSGIITFTIEVPGRAAISTDQTGIF